MLGYLRQWSTAGKTGDKERTSAPGLSCSDVISVTEGKWKEQAFQSKIVTITNHHYYYQPPAAAEISWYLTHYENHLSNEVLASIYR